MRNLRPAAMILVGLVLLFTISMGALWALTGNADEPQTAAAPIPLIVNNPVRGADDVTEVAQDIHIEIEEPAGPGPYAIIVDYDYLPWNLKLVNRYNMLDADFEPYLSSVGGGHYFDARAAESLEAMMAAAREEGLSPIVTSSYRSISRQRVLFENQYNRRRNDGYDHEQAVDLARRVVAYPGESEHNLGLAVDIVADHHRNLDAAFGQTPEGIWLAQNSWRYGFVLRYPDDMMDITHIIYEPWHFRYVGANHAAAMFERNLVLEEYIALLLESNQHLAMDYVNLPQVRHSE
jgi:D-alanyl-D-alanine carboxypeptidase